MPSGQLDRRLEVVDPGRGGQQPVEQRADRHAVGRDVGPHRIAAGRAVVAARPGKPEGEHRTRRVGAAQRGERPGRRGRVERHDRVEGFAESGLDRRLPAGVDADEVEQRAKHARGPRQALGAGARVGGVERELQGIDAGGPARRALPGFPVGALDRVDLGLDRLAAGLGLGDLLEQRRLDELGRVAVVTSLVGLLGELVEPVGQRPDAVG